MKNALLWAVVVVLSVSSLLAAPVKISNTRIVQAQKDTTLTYAGVKVFVPADQTIILGTHPDGSVGVRGQDLQGVKVGSGTFTSRGAVVFAVNPQEQVVSVQKGELMVTDAGGRITQVSAGSSVSIQSVRSTLPTSGEAKPAPAKKIARNKNKAALVAKTEEAQDAAQDTLVVPSFVASTATSSAASEQAAQDAEDNISPSAPR